ncbi:MAG: DUF5702 domain-containing protein, partial [Lachnospiraceae bacterium]|nr:DUF5702 domain-containing protein [Lachnospiraceae bacterium]
YTEKSVACLKLKSSMTIYITLVLVIIMALIFTLIESGRVSAVNTKLRSITYMSADSVFAEFAQPLFDQYGVMMLWADEEEFMEAFTGYISENLNLKGTDAGSDLDLYGMRYAESSLVDVKWITDDGGKLFAEQVYDYMKVHLIESVAEQLLSRTDFFEQSEKVREVLGTISEYQSEFIKVEESISEINDKVNHIKDLSENPRTLLEEMQRDLELYQDEGDQEAANRFSENRTELKTNSNEIQQELSAIQNATENYYQNVDAAKDGILAMKEELELSKEEYTPEIYQAIQKRIEEIEDTGSEEGAGYQTIKNNAEAAANYQETMKGLDSFFDATDGAVSEENVGTYQEMTSQALESVTGFDMLSLDAGSAAEQTGSADLSFIENVNQKSKTGVLDLLAGDISEKQIDQSSFPSVTSMEKETEEEEDFVDKTVQKALFAEYDVEHFGCYTNIKENTALDYEVEYILGGKDNDRANLSAVATELILIRSGANLVNLMLDSTKQAEIRELATAVSFGQVYIMKIAELLITTAWALAEAMLDTKALFEGKKIPLIKQQDDWFLSLEGLKNFTGEEATESDEEFGLGYEDYLRVILLLEKKEDQRFRTMDMIQANMCLNENADFRIKDCIAQVKAEVSYSAPGVFAALPIVQRTAASDTTGYQFRFIQEYAY